MTQPHHLFWNVGSVAPIDIVTNAFFATLLAIGTAAMVGAFLP